MVLSYRAWGAKGLQATWVTTAKAVEERFKGTALLHGDPQVLFNSKQVGLFHSGLIKTHKNNFFLSFGQLKLKKHFQKGPLSRIPIFLFVSEETTQQTDLALVPRDLSPHAGWGQTCSMGTRWAAVGCRGQQQAALAPSLAYLSSHHPPW